MKNYSTHPDKDRPYFLNDPAGEGLLFFSSAEDRDEAMKEILDLYLEDNEWLDETPDICAGTLSHVVRPLNDNPEDDGYDYGFVTVAAPRDQ